MTRLILASIISLIISYIGVKIKGYYLHQVRYLEDYNEFLLELIEEVSFFRRPLDEFVGNICEYKGKLFKKSLMEFKQQLTSGTSINISTNSIDKRYIKVIQNCFESIGKVDPKTELLGLKAYKSNAESLLKDAKEKLNKKGDLYSKLIILLGIAVLIMMV